MRDFSIKALIFLASVLLVTACASVSDFDHRQRVHVQSKPDGADILVDGVKVAETPAYVFLPRTKNKQEMVLVNEGKELKLEMPSHYRWVESGVYNLGLIGFAAYGLAVDLITGTAWEVDENQYANFETNSRKLEKRKIEPNDMVVVMAPLQGQSEWMGADLMDRMSIDLEKQIKKRKMIIKAQELRLLPYWMTRELFEKYKYDFCARPVEQEKMRNELQTELLATHLFEGTYDLRNGKYVVWGRLINLKNPDDVIELTREFAPTEIKYVRESRWQGSVGALFPIFPNNFSLIAASSRSDISLNDDVFEAENRSTDGILGQFSSVISSFSLNYLDGPTQSRYWKSSFTFLPSVVFNWSSFEYQAYNSENKLNAIAGIHFTKLIFGVGYGAQWSLTSRWGRFFIEVIPYASQLNVKYDKVDGGDAEKSAFGIESSSRVGYTYFLNDKFNLTIFSSVLNESSGLWQKVVDSSTGTSGKYAVSSSSTLISGFSFGYYFSVDKNPIRKIFTKEN